MRDERWLFAAWLALIFVGCVVLYTTHNDFPLGRQPDEMSKFRQIHRGGWNFYHPQLILQTTRLVAALRFEAPERVHETETGWLAIPRGRYARDVVQAGRTVSAVFAATAVVLAALAARLLFGPAAGYAAAPVVGASHALLTAAHYLKEDTPLILGIMATLVALAWTARRATAPRAAMVGAAAGMAAAGKYVGLVLLPFALTVQWLLWCGEPRGKRWRAIAVAAGFAAIVFAVINYEMLLHPGRTLAGLRFEVRHVVEAEGQIRDDPTRLLYARMLGHETNALVLGLAIATAGWLLWARLGRRARGAAPQRSPQETVRWVVLLLPAIWFVLVSLSSIQRPRYLLPTVVFVHLLAGVGVGLAVRAWAGRAWWKPVAAGLIGVVVATPGLLICRHYLELFERDSRDAAIDWMRERLPDHARIAADWYAMLPHGELRPGGPEVVATPKEVVMFGDLDAMRDAGITHVVICSLSSDRELNPYKIPDRAIEVQHHERRARYRQILDRGELLWSSKRFTRQPFLFNPHVWVYRLPRSDRNDDAPANGPKIDGVSPAARQYAGASAMAAASMRSSRAATTGRSRNTM